MGGGLAVFFAMTVALALAWATHLPLLENDTGQPELSALGIVLASLVIVGVGVIDDCKGLLIQQKLLGQLLAVSILLCSGLAVREIRVSEFHLSLGWLSLPFTIFWMLGAINSWNLIDGMDGLLSTAGLISCLALSVVAVSTGNGNMACLALALGGALLGFLRYNYPPASIFLGDGGSMLVGLLLGLLSIQSSFAEPGVCSLAAPLAILIIPILDTTAAIFRRTWAGKSICAADCCHIHHCLLTRGFSSRQVLFHIACLCLVGAVGALLSVGTGSDGPAILATLGVTGVAIRGGLFACAVPSVRRIQASRSPSFLFFRKTVLGQPLGARTEKFRVGCQGFAEGIRK
jgi:UDP-GlcNAc:undecaprenyl-phosphate GlcNAc-1-phosphate transferase